MLSYIFFKSKTTLGEILGGILVVLGLVMTVAGRDIESRLKRREGQEAGGSHARRGSHAPLVHRPKSDVYDERI